MPSSQTQSHHGSMLEPCKLTLLLSLFVSTLPSLFLSLIIFSIVAFLLFLPIVCTLCTIYLLSCILSRLPISLDEICAPKVDQIEDQKQECIELDSFEVPRLDESSSTTSSTEEQERLMKELVEMDHEEFCRLLERFGSVQSDGFMSFYEVLSFWRSMERTCRQKVASGLTNT